MDLHASSPADLPHLREPVLRIGDVVRSDDFVARLSPAGEIDADSADDLLSAVRDVLLIHCPVALELDLGQVTFLDAAGARCLRECRVAAQDQGAGLTLANLRGGVRMVLDILQMSALFGLAEPDDPAPGVCAPARRTRPAVPLATAVPWSPAGALDRLFAESAQLQAAAREIRLRSVALRGDRRSGPVR